MTAALEQARQLYRVAREHKRLASHHRQAARDTFAEIERICADFGFVFELVKEGEDGSHGRKNDPHPIDPHP